MKWYRKETGGCWWLNASEKLHRKWRDELKTVNKRRRREKQGKLGKHKSCDFLPLDGNKCKKSLFTGKSVFEHPSLVVFPLARRRSWRSLPQRLILLLRHHWIPWNNTAKSLVAWGRVNISFSLSPLSLVQRVSSASLQCSTVSFRRVGWLSLRGRRSVVKCCRLIHTYSRNSRENWIPCILWLNIACRYIQLNPVSDLLCAGWGGASVTRKLRVSVKWSRNHTVFRNRIEWMTWKWLQVPGNLIKKSSNVQTHRGREKMQICVSHLVLMLLPVKCFLAWLKVLCRRRRALWPFIVCTSPPCFTIR